MIQRELTILFPHLNHPSDHVFSAPISFWSNSCLSTFYLLLALVFDVMGIFSYWQWQSQFHVIKRMKVTCHLKIFLKYILWERVSVFNESVLSLEKARQTPSVDSERWASPGKESTPCHSPAPACLTPSGKHPSGAEWEGEGPALVVRSLSFSLRSPDISLLSFGKIPSPLWFSTFPSIKRGKSSLDIYPEILPSLKWFDAVTSKTYLCWGTRVANSRARLPPAW